ncbi:MAG: carbon starvation protein A [Pseudomonadota bacterium]
MNAAQILVAGLVTFLLGYRFYSRYLANQIFQINERDPAPAKKYQDGRDFVPTKLSILWGHHFSSIAGAAPIVGPAVAVIWGWLPALLWVVFGTLFLGAAHDFGALVLSMKYRGRSVASLSGDLVSKRVRLLFLTVVLFLVWMVIAVFALVIANLFIRFPSSVLPVNFEIFVALAIGYFINRKGRSILGPAVIAQILLFVMMYLGSLYPIRLDGLSSDPLLLWIVFLLIYSLIASVLPVWALLQPRDYINSHQLVIGLSLMVIGACVLNPPLVAPVWNQKPVGAPPWFPFLFITIACGAISGFHGLVSSGTTSKQVAKWSDARPIGYGAMVGEGLLALLATLAVSTGFESPQAWHNHYETWGAAKGLSASIEAFVLGSARFLESLGIGPEFSRTMMSVLIISFAATSLDTATRIQRYVISEVGEITNQKFLTSPWISAGLAVLSALFLMFIQSGGKGGLVLWPLFGATNQMLASLTLMLICVYLIKRGKKVINYFIPFVFVYIMTFLGLLFNCVHFLFHKKSLLLLALSLVLLVIQILIAYEAKKSLRNSKESARIGIAE